MDSWLKPMLGLSEPFLKMFLFLTWSFGTFIRLYLRSFSLKCRHKKRGTGPGRDEMLTSITVFHHVPLSNLCGVLCIDSQGCGEEEGRQRENSWDGPSCDNSEDVLCVFALVGLSSLINKPRVQRKHSGGTTQVSRRLTAAHKSTTRIRRVALR